MTSLHERIADLALSTFDKLPQKCKPRILPDRTREWTPMSAIVLAQDRNLANEALTCVSLATGTKCLPNTTLPAAHGSVLHDSHAEILALRGLNYFFLSELRRLISGPDQSSSFLETSPSTDSRSCPYRLNPNLSIHLYTTAAPCGAASLDRLIASRPENNEPWSLPHPEPGTVDSQQVLHGHGGFDPALFHRVRTKPSRADAPPTFSKSCTDKLALSQFTGLLRFPVDLFISPVYLDSVVMPHDAFHEVGWKRAFARDGRLTILEDVVLAKAKYFAFSVLPDDYAGKFEFAREHSRSGKVSNISALYLANGICEVLINGVKQGFRQDSDKRGKESVVCRRRMWELSRKVVELTSSRASLKKSTAMIAQVLDTSPYRTAKHSSLRGNRKELKEQITQKLEGWAVNSGDDNWPRPAPSINK